MRPAPGSSLAHQRNADAGAEHLQRAVAELAAFEGESPAMRDSSVRPSASASASAVQRAARTDDGADAGEGSDRRRQSGGGRRFQHGERRLGIDAEPGEHRQMQRQRHRQAARRGEGDLGAAGRDQRTAPCAASSEPPSSVMPKIVVAPRLGGEPARHFGALARLRGDDHRLVRDGKRRGELLGEGKGDGIDAEAAIERLDDARHRVRGAHAEHEQPAAGGDRVGGRAAVSPAPANEARASSAWRAISCSIAARAAPVRTSVGIVHPFTPPWVRPEISARCMTRPTSTGGSAASTPAVAISP